MVGLNEVGRKRAGGFSLAWAAARNRRRAARNPQCCCSTSGQRLDPEGVLWIRNLMKHLG